MLSRKFPIPSHFLALAFLCTGAHKVCKTKGQLFQRWLVRPSSATYAARDMSSGGRNCYFLYLSGKLLPSVCKGL